MDRRFSQPDPFATIPDAETIRGLIASSVEYTQRLRRLLRVALRESRGKAPAQPLALNNTQTEAGHAS